MPSLNDLLDAKRAAVKTLEKKQADTKRKLDDLARAQREVGTTWSAAAGGISLKHASQDQGFHATLDGILDERITVKRDQNLLDEWRAGLSETSEQEAAADETPTEQKAKRSQTLDLDLENLDAAKLLQNLNMLEAEATRARNEEADAQADVKETSKKLRRRDNHWRIKVGESVLAHARQHDEFRHSLDRIVEQHIAEHHRPLLDRWRRNRTTPGTAPPAAAATGLPAATAAGHRGWKPKKLPDSSWGAVFRNPADATLPEPLVGAVIAVKTIKRGELIKKITEVIASDDTEVLVRAEELEPRNTIASRGASPAAENETAAKESEQSPDATAKRSAG